MARLPRITVPGIAHYVTQRGNRRQQVFIQEDDYALYRDLLAQHCVSNSVLRWARLLKRVFDIDIEHCPHCGGSLTIIAAIVDPGVIAKILRSLGLPTRASPRSPAQTLDFVQTD